MTDQHPIAQPPIKLFKQWEDDILNERENVDVVLDCAWRNGFQAGADQELEECVSYVDNNFSGNKARALRAIRRPKPPSIKEQALAELRQIPINPEAGVVLSSVETIRRALEQLPD